MKSEYSCQNLATTLLGLNLIITKYTLFFILLYFYIILCTSSSGYERDVGESSVVVHPWRLEVELLSIRNTLESFSLFSTVYLFQIVVYV